MDSLKTITSSESQNIIPPQSGRGFKLLQGQTLVVTDIKGSQVSDLFCFNLHDYKEYFSAGRTIDYNDKIFITKGHKLYSNRSSVMLSITDDTCGRNDLLLTPCSLKMFQIVSKNNQHHPSCLENLSKAFASYGISEDQIHSTFNIFMNVQVDQEGSIQIEKPKSKAGDYIRFTAEMDLLVALTSCSHEETNDHKFSEIQYQIL